MGPPQGDNDYRRKGAVNDNLAGSGALPRAFSSGYFFIKRKPLKFIKIRLE